MPQQQRNQQLSQGSQTIAQGESNEHPVLHLTATHTEEQPEDEGSARRVRWSEDTVDNELMNKKKSKICCIFHPNSMDYEEESESSGGESDSSSSSSSSDSSNEDNQNDGIEDYNRKNLKKRGKSKKKSKNRVPEDHKHCCHDHDTNGADDSKKENSHENNNGDQQNEPQEEYPAPLPNAYEYQPKFRLVKDPEGKDRAETKN